MGRKDRESGRHGGGLRLGMGWMTGRVRLPALIVKIWQVSCQIAVDRRCCNRSEPLNLHNIRIFGPPIIVLCYIPLRISDN